MLPDFLSGLINSPDSTKTHFSGVHYAKEPIKGGVLHGEKRGMTGEGEESDRVYLPPRGAPAAIHVYEDDGQVFGKHPQILARPHAYKVEGDFNLADVSENPHWKQAKEEGKNLASQNGADEATSEMVGRNEAEWKLKELGYDGYRSKNFPSNVVLFGSHQAKSLDKDAKGKTNPQTSSEDVSVPTKAANLQASTTQIKYPQEGLEENENHLPNSDPANLSAPYQKLFGIVPRNASEHVALTQAASQV